MEVNIKLDVHEIDGEDGAVTNDKSITVRSHHSFDFDPRSYEMLNDRGLIVLQVAGVEYAVSVEELALAVERCSSPRYK